MKTKKNCPSCGNRKQALMNNHFICSSCDELMLDLEIECDDYTRPAASPVSTLTALKKRISTRQEKRAARR